MSVFAIVPAKSRSTGIPGKNWKPLCGISPVERAIMAAQDAHCFDRIIVSGDDYCPILPTTWDWLERPADLCQDTTPMVDVVKHAVEFSRLLIARNPHWTGRDNPEEQDIFVLAQPTQPLRQPKHLTAAIELLQSSGAESVVSVVELPRTHAPEWVLRIHAGELWHFCEDGSLRHVGDSMMSDSPRPTRRQDIPPTYIRDGTAYCFRRGTVAKHGNIYGRDVRPLIIPAEETCPLDTLEDWADAERRLRAL